MSIPTSRQIQELYLQVVDLEARVTALDGGVPPARSAGKKADEDDDPPKRKK